MLRRGAVCATGADAKSTLSMSPLSTSIPCVVESRFTCHLITRVKDTHFSIPFGKKKSQGSWFCRHNPGKRPPKDAFILNIKAGDLGVEPAGEVKLIMIGAGDAPMFLLLIPF